MGKAFLRVKKPDQRTQDGIAVDAIASADCVGGLTEVEITGTDPKNPRIKFCNEVKVYSGEDDITTSKAIEIVGIVVTDDSDGKNKLEELRVVKRGSGISGSPEVRILKKTGTDYTNAADYVTGSITLGGGDPEAELILISENGQDTANVDGLFLKVESNALGEDKWTNSAKEYAKFFDGDFKQVEEIKLFDPYKKKINYDDLKAFGTKAVSSIAQYSALTNIQQIKTQTAQANKALEVEAAQAKQINITRKAGYESDKILAEQEASEDYYGALDAWQQKWDTDLSSMSLYEDPAASPVDPVWNAAVQAVSTIFNLYRTAGIPIPQTNASPNTSLIDNFENITGNTFPSLGAPQYPQSPTYLNETFTPIQTPRNLDTYEKIAKGFLIKTICFAAIGTLGGIFSRLSGKSGTFSKSSAHKIDYSARCWSENNRDGLFTSWFRSEMRSHDLFAHLLTIFNSIGGIIGSLGSVDRRGISDDNSKRLDAMVYSGVAAGYIESLKSLYGLLGKWVEFYTTNKNVDSGKFGFSNPDRWRQFIQKLEIIRGRIAVELDGVAYNWQREAGSSTPEASEIQPRITLVKKAEASPSYIKQADITNRGVLLPGGYFSGSSILDITLAKAQGLDLTHGFAGQLPTYGLETATIIPTIKVNVKFGYLDNVVIDDGGGGFYWNNLSAIVRVPANLWFNVGIGERSILIPDQTKPADIPNIEGGDHREGASAEINDATYTGEDLEAKYKHIEKSLSSFSSDICGKLVDESLNFDRVIEYLIKNSSPEVKFDEGVEFGTLIEIKTWTPTLGDCSNQEIQKIDGELATTFFRDPGAYAIKLAPQKAKELLCKKESCGVAHVYSQPPMVDELLEAPMCGDVTVRYNLHPTAEWRITKANKGTFFNELLGHDTSLDMIGSLRIKDGLDQKGPPNGPWSSASKAAGTDGDMTLPAVFGNYSFAFENAKEGFSLVNLFGSIIKAVTLGIFAGGTLKDPRITRPINKYHQQLLVDYNSKRLFREENFEIGGGNPHMPGYPFNNAPDKKNAGGGLWNGQDTSNYFRTHSDKLKTAYKTVVNAGGLNQFKTALDDSTCGTVGKEVKPLLSVQQTFSGMCYPVVREWDVARRPYRIVTNSMSLGTWGPTSNNHQKHEEFSIGRKGGQGGEYGHLPPDGAALGEADDSTRVAGSNFGINANKDVFISEYPYFSDIHKEAKQQINNISRKVTRYEIEDINFSVEIDENRMGKLAGDGKPLDQDTVNNNTTAHLQTNYCIDVNGYKTEALAARGKGWFNPFNKNIDAWDSNDLKSKYKVPHYKPEAKGNNYISGVQGDSTGQALTNAEIEYKTYTGNVNVFHLTGHPIFKTGIRTDPIATYKKTGYSNVSENAATTAAAALLEAVSAWSGAKPKLDSEGNSLARSGIDTSEINRVDATWNGSTKEWSPIEPAVRPPGITTYITGKGHDATAANAHFTSLKASACAKGEIDGVVSNTVTFSGSITGQGGSHNDALTNAMNALNIYSNTQYNLYGSGLNADRTSPVNTVGLNAYNFFRTGVTTTVYSTGVGMAPLTLFDPSDSYTTSPTKQAWASRFLYKSALTHLHQDDLCLTLDTATDCNFTSGVSNMTLHNDCDNTPMVGCDVKIIDSANSASNWLTAMSGVRRLTYETIRERLGLQHHNVDNDFTDGQCHESSIGAYSTGDFPTSGIVVFPNTGALVHVEANQANVGWGLSGDIALGNEPSWSSNGVRSMTQANNAITGKSDTDAYQIVNLKDWTAGTGDLDIYVAEDIMMLSSIVGGGDCVPARTLGSWKRHLGHYRYRTAIFNPLDMGNISGAIAIGSFTRSNGATTTTTPLIAPTVVTGSGLCNLYDSQVFQTVITGDYADVKATAFVPLMRNEYNVSASISGTIPTITGACDWSSRHKQTWYDANSSKVVQAIPREESSNWGENLYKPQKDQLVDRGEKYYIKYEEGIEGLQSTWMKTGNNRVTQQEKEQIKNFAPNNQNPANALEGGDAITESVTPMKKPSPLDLGKIVELVTDDVTEKTSSKYFLGGWPIKNQASSQEDAKSVDKQGKVNFTTFADEYVIVKSPNEKWGTDINDVLEKIIKKDSTLKSRKIVFLDSKKATKFVDNVRNTQSNIKDITVESFKLTYAKEMFTLVEGENEAQKMMYNVRALGIGSRSVPAELKSGPVTFVYYRIQYNAAACQGCVTSPADEMINEPVIFYHENYLQFAQVDWQMRSGDYHFEVPYLEPGLVVEDSNGKKVIAKHWSEYISSSFVTEGLGNYTGHYTAYGETFVGKPTQIGCPEEHDAGSKISKIVDYQIGFGKEASYRKLKDLGSNEIVFDKPPQP